MCGICGEVAFRGRLHLDGLSRSLESLRARGPDAGGLFMRKSFAAGHRRLSILDLSSGAEMSPKGHSVLWQAALLEGWLQAHAI